MKAMHLFVVCIIVMFLGREQRSNEYTIGAIYNLEGSQASLDSPSAKGAELAVQIINAQGGIRGKKLKLILEDGKSDPAVIKKVTEKLIKDDNVPVIIGFSDTDMVLASAPIAAEHEVIFITSGATSPKLPEQVPTYLYLSCFGDNVQAAVVAEYAFSRLGLHSCFMLTDENMDFTRLLSKYFIKRYSELGGEIIKESFFQGGTNNVQDIINEIIVLDQQPAMLFVSAGPNDVGNIIKQIRMAGITQPICGGDSYDTPLLIKTAGEYADNIYFATHFMVKEYTDDVYFTSPPAGEQEDSDKTIMEFITAYKNTYGTLPSSSFAALGYDAVMLVAEIYKRAIRLNPDGLFSTLSHIRDFPGVTGTISYNEDQKIPQKGVTLIKISNREQIFLESLVPSKIPAP
ncbi:MAG TPA: amino acid ABC transporter substrate-binding protein [Candidatus Cloacimonetes bacterium]|nr:amino acid ABC transporter substrate-binding protein [Candidatus Cloacimonadota bacterium]HEX38312.1 amino acid ABC transporter substrate-binding protein [Candidatus Cloacimonadota bacterium]